MCSESPASAGAIVDLARAVFERCDPIAANRADHETGTDGKDDLFDAIARRDHGRAREILRDGNACVRWLVFGEASRRTGNTAAHAAAMQNDVATLEAILDGLRFVSETFAVQSRRYDCGMSNRFDGLTRCFLAAPNRDRGNTPLHSACAVGAADAVAWLWKHAYQDVYSRNPVNYEGLDALSVLCSFHNAQRLGPGLTKNPADFSDEMRCMKILMEDFAYPVNTADEVGLTPLHYAARSGADDLVRELLKRGADPFTTPMSLLNSMNLKDHKGLNPDTVLRRTHDTPLMLAKREGNASTMKILRAAMDEISAKHAKEVDKRLEEDLEFLLVPPSQESTKKAKKKKKNQKKEEPAVVDTKEPGTKEPEILSNTERADSAASEEKQRETKQEIEVNLSEDETYVRQKMAAKERAEEERLAKVKERLANERTAKEQAEKERLANMRAERERAEKERAEKERITKERSAKERAEKERLAKERAEKERLAKERAEKERLAKERAENEQSSVNWRNKEESPPSVLKERSASVSSETLDSNIYDIEDRKIQIDLSRGCGFQLLSAIANLQRERGGHSEGARDEHSSVNTTALPDADDDEPEWASEVVPKKPMDHSDMIMPQFSEQARVDASESDLDEASMQLPVQSRLASAWSQVPQAVHSSEGVPPVRVRAQPRMTEFAKPERLIPHWDREIFTAEVEPDWSALDWVVRATERMDAIHLEACASGVNCGHVLGVDIDQLSFGQLDALEEVHRELLARITDARVALARRQERAAVMEEMAIAEAQKGFKMLSEFEKPLR